MANPSGNHHEQAHASTSFNGVNGGNPHSGSTLPETSPTVLAMKHNPGISLDWSAEEQAVLDEGLVKHTSESSIIRYAKIAVLLQNKTVRDVAMRVRWMNKKENSKRRKEEHSLTRKSKDKKERVADPSSKSSHLAARSNVPPYAPPVISIDNDDGVPYKAIGGPSGELLEQTAQTLNQISANLASFKIQENINLLCLARDNISRLLNETDDGPEVMKQMPPLPVKVNEDLANSILPRTSHQIQ